MVNAKPRIGIVGGVGAGKSAVAAAFARQGCLVIDSDADNREILREPHVIAQIRSWWGDELLDAAGQVRRDRLAERVFADEADRRRLESLTHPLIGQRRDAMIAMGNRNPAVRAIILDSPLLLESNLDRICDAVVFVDADEASRLARVQQGRGWDQAELRRRESSQLPLDEKRRRSDYVIRNDGPLENLDTQVTDVLARVVRAFQASLP